MLGLLAPVCLADNSSPITLDTSETLFTVLTAMNACGYDISLNISDAQRLNIRADVQKNLKGSEEAQAAMTAMCDWYVAHKGKDPAHDLSQYVSLLCFLVRFDILPGCNQVRQVGTIFHKPLQAIIEFR